MGLFPCGQSIRFAIACVKANESIAATNTFVLFLSPACLLFVVVFAFLLWYTLRKLVEVSFEA
jgi:hypothetical protein